MLRQHTADIFIRRSPNLSPLALSQPRAGLGLFIKKEKAPPITDSALYSRIAFARSGAEVCPTMSHIGTPYPEDHVFRNVGGVVGDSLQVARNQ